MMKLVTSCLMATLIAFPAYSQNNDDRNISLSYVKNGAIHSEQKLKLRNKEASQKILKALLPVSASDPSHSIWNTIPLQPALTDEKKKEYVALAWETYENTEADLINIIHGAPNPGGPYSNNRKSYLLDIRRMAFSIIGAYGSFDDVPRLLDAAYIQRENGSVYIQDEPLVAASTIQGRLGLFGHIFVEKSYQHLPDRPHVAAAYAWAGSLYGNQLAARHLREIYTEHYDVLSKPGMWFMTKSVRALAAAPAEMSSLDLMRKIADDYNAAVSGADVKGIKSLPTPLAWSMPYVLTYLQAHGDETDAERINNVKILRRDYSPVLFALAEYPVPLAVQAVSNDIEPKYTRKKLPFQYFCAGLFDRNSKESFQFADEFKSVWLDSQPPSSDPQARDKYANAYDIEISSCTASDTAAKLIAGGQEPDSRGNAWIKSTAFLPEISNAMNGMQGTLPILSLGYFTKEMLKGNIGQGRYTDILLAYHDLIDAQHFTPVDVSSGTRRAFVRTVNEDTTTLSGVIDISPRVKNDKLQVGIRFMITGGISSSQGFAQAISGESYDIVGMQEKGGLPLIDIVSLETVKDKKEMTFVRTTDSGVHIFETPYDGDGSNSWVEIFLTAAGDRWPVHVPLYRHLKK